MITRSVGSRALLVEVDSSAEALSLAAVLRVSDLAVDEIVPGARTLLLDGLDDPDAVAAQFARVQDGWFRDAPPPWRPPAEVADRALSTLRLVELPTTYDGQDLARVADLWEVAIDEVIRRHTSVTFTSAFCGFAPGFAYLSGLPQGWQVPRLAEPRTRVPAGSVAIAGEWCGVYPVPSPGGWLLLGRTDETLWDPAAAEPALLAPGTRVRFTVA